MANLIDTPTGWEAGIYQLETTDPVMGGVPNTSTMAGIDNIPHLQLARRTQFLYSQLQALQSGAGYRAAQAITSNTTLTSADLGKVFAFTGASAATLTLPSIASAPDGAVFEITNLGSAAVTVQRAGTDEIDLGATNSTSVIVGVGRSLRLIRVGGATVWYVVGATAAAPSAIRPPAVAASGPSVEINGINGAAASRIVVLVDNISTNGASVPIVQLGTAAAWITSGYDCTNVSAQAGAGTGSDPQRATTGVPVASGPFFDATTPYSGRLVFERWGITNRWTISGSTNRMGFAAGGAISGVVTLPAEVTRLRLNTVVGTDSFDAGEITIIVEP